jgi:hypothetical protein
MKEYGGYFPIDGFGEEYFSQLGIEEGNIVRMNAARYAIVAAFRDSKCDKIWVPLYMCQTVFEALKNVGIEFQLYHIDRNGFPLLDEIKENEIILATNYCGIKTNDYYEKIQCKYKKVIFDNTQAFYAEPVLRENVYNVYSPRKFFGVPDGAYLISNHCIDICKYKQDVSYANAMYLLKAIELGTDAAYADYMDNEERISQSGPCIMSKLTKHLLSGIDYAAIEKVRNKNFDYLNRVFSDINGWVGARSESSPMVYPLLLQTNADKIRKSLVENGVYVSQWWKWVIDSDGANEYEKELSRNLLPIPIDQRYTIDDMKELAKVLLYIINQ